MDWCWDDFLRDVRVMAMDSPALGTWVRLLGAFALSEHPGELLGDESVLRRMSGATDDEWAGCRDQVLLCVTRTERGWLHARTKRDHEAQTRRISLRKQASAEGNRRRWYPDGVPMGSQTEGIGTPDGARLGLPPSLLHSVTEKEEEPKTLVQQAGRPRRVASPEEQDWEEAFGFFWKEYPKKQGKIDAHAAWLKVSPKGQEGLDVVMKGLYRWQKAWTDLKYVPLPGVWLRKQRYNDEIPEA